MRSLGKKAHCWSDLNFSNDENVLNSFFLVQFVTKVKETIHHTFVSIENRKHQGGNLETKIQN